MLGGATRPTVYIAHPISGDVNRNLMRAKMWFRWAALSKAAVPVAPYISCVWALDDNDPDERLVGMAISSRVSKMCDELWLCGEEISEGMRKERQIFEKRDKPVVDLTGYSIPSEMIGGPSW